MARTGQKRILFVSQDASLLYTRERILRSAGLDVESTSSVEHALEAIEAHQVDLTLIGHALSISARKELIARCRLSNIPVVFIMSIAEGEGEPLADASTGPMPADLLCTVKRMLALI